MKGKQCSDMCYMRYYYSKDCASQTNSNTTVVHIKILFNTLLHQIISSVQNQKHTSLIKFEVFAVATIFVNDLKLDVAL